MNALFLILLLFVSTTTSFFTLPRSHTYRSTFGIEMAGKEPLVLDGLQLVLERRDRPEHIKFARRKMQLPFAVQLMRQSYNAIDVLKFVPTEEFQKSFFLFRQSEWDDYRTYYPNLFQGDLSDPLYFDHVSFAQYAVIADKMRRGKTSFIQLIDANGTAQSMQRDPLLENNDLLPIAHSKIVGDALLDWMIEVYPTITPPNLPFANNTAAYKRKPNAASLEEFVKYAQDVLDIMELNSYALSMKVEALPEKDSLNSKQQLVGVRMVGPANLWGGQVLRRRGDAPVNDFEIKLLASLAERLGLRLRLISTTVSNNANVLHVIKIE